MEWLPRLVDDLAEDGRPVTVDDATGHVLVEGFGTDVVWHPPVRLALTEVQLREHLERMADDAVDVFPGVDPLQAAYQLFLVHVDEELATKVLPGSELRLENGDLHAFPERELGLDVPEGEGPFMFVSPEQLTRMTRDLRRTGRAARDHRRRRRRAGSGW